MELTGTQLKAEIVRRGVRQQEVAAKMGMDPSLFSKHLAGVLKWPDNFAADCRRAIEAVAEEKILRLRGEEPLTV